MAIDRLVSLDAACSATDGPPCALLDLLPDLNSLQQEEQRLLMLDIDHALERLTPFLREVLIARFMRRIHSLGRSSAPR